MAAESMTRRGAFGRAKRTTEVGHMSERISLVIGRFYAYRQLKQEEGQGAVEYALAVLAVAAIIAAAMAGFTTEITNFMTKAGTKLQSYVP
jgi:Flp pilus assembly pilin Flp